MSIERDIERLQERVSELEQELLKLRSETIAARYLVACDDCGGVFKGSDTYGEHLCQGGQGR